MPNRIVREGILTSKRVNQLSLGAELFYRRLMSVADDYGRYYADKSILLSGTWPRNDGQVAVKDISAWLDECTQGPNPLICVYEAGGDTYLQINNFKQRTRQSKSRFLDPPNTNDGQLTVIRRTAVGHSSVNCSLARADAPSANTNTNTSANTNTNEEGPGETEESAGSTAISAIRLDGGIRATEPEEREPSSAEADEFSAWAEAAYARHPKKKHKHLALLALKQRFSRDPAARERFDENHRLWCATPDWLERGGRFCPPLCELDGHGFVNDDGWIHPPVRGEPDVGKRDAGSYLRGRLRELEAKGEMAK